MKSIEIDGGDKKKDKENNDNIHNKNTTMTRQSADGTMTMTRQSADGTMTMT